MNFVCPRCRHHITSHDAATTRCPACGLVLNLVMGDTRDGQPALPIDRDLSGQKLGAYEIGECIGSGGMGIVYRAAHSESKRVVALKVLAPHLSAQQDFVARFQREAEALRSLRHPNIVAFLDEGVVENRRYIAMELVEGVSLEEQIRDTTLPLIETVAVGLDIASALAAAHERGITHRDLKPANVMLTKGGVKVLDFGIAQLAFSEVTLTRSEALIGTINYMAPEQRLKSAPVDHRADIYSLGVILYRCLTGVLPFGSFEPPSRLTRGVPRRADRVLDRMLQRDPERRYQAVTGVRADLRRLLPRPPVRRRQVASVAGGVAVVAIGIALSLTGLEQGAELAPSVATPPTGPTTVEPTPKPATPPEAEPIESPPARQPPAAEGKPVRTESPAKPVAAEKKDAARAEPPPAEKPTHDPKGYYRVVNVAVGDVLTVRAEPNPAAEKVGALAPDALCVRSDGQRRRVGKSWWLSVMLDERHAGSSSGSMYRFAASAGTAFVTGWVNESFLEWQPASECGKRKVSKKNTL